MTSALYATAGDNGVPVETLLREWSLAEWPEPLSVVYVDEASSNVMHLCEALAGVVGDGVAEWTVRTFGYVLPLDNLSALAAGGVDRFCLVVQPDEMGDLEGYVRGAREAGFRSIAVDLETKGPLRDAVCACVGMGVDHVSTYEAGDEAMCGTELDEAAEMLEAAGYDRYELWSFARSGHRCRYTEACWRCANYVALGPGAASHLAGRRWSNTCDTVAYVEALQGGVSPPREYEDLTPESLADEMIAFGLNLRDGIDPSEVAYEVERAFPRLGNRSKRISQHWKFRERLLQGFEREGLVARRGGRWLLTREGLHRADHVAREILAGALS